MSGFLRGIARIRTVPALRGSTITQRANIASRPAKDALGPVVVSVGRRLFPQGQAGRARRSPLVSVRADSDFASSDILIKATKATESRAETTVGLAVFTLTILGPAGWVLANLENYKKRDSASE